MLNLYKQMQMILFKTSPLIKLESLATDIPLWPDLTAVPRCHYTTTIIATVLMFLRIVSKVCVADYMHVYILYILEFIQFIKYDNTVLQINNETCFLNIG